VAGIASLVQHLVEDEEVAPSEILILVRGDHNRVFSGPIRAALDGLGIANSDPKEIQDLLEDRANRRTIALLRLLVDRDDSLAWATLIHLTGGVGDRFQDYVYERAVTHSQTYSRALLDALDAGFPGGPPSSASARATIEAIIEWLDQHQVPQDPVVIAWGNWMIATADGAETLGAGVSSRLAELLVELDALTEPDEDLGRYLGQIAPRLQDLAQTRSGGVRIMTMGSSKGLTVRATILAAAESDRIPDPRGDPAEERRLLYVAMTRAKEFLYCTWAQRRYGPTARAGGPNPGGNRRPSPYFTDGPVATQDGASYIRTRWT